MRQYNGKITPEEDLNAFAAFTVRYSIMKYTVK